MRVYVEDGSISTDIVLPYLPGGGKFVILAMSYLRYPALVDLVREIVPILTALHSRTGLYVRTLRIGPPRDSHPPAHAQILPFQICAPPHVMSSEHRYSRPKATLHWDDSLKITSPATSSYLLQAWEQIDRYVNASAFAPSDAGLAMLREVFPEYIDGRDIAYQAATRKQIWNSITDTSRAPGASPSSHQPTALISLLATIPKLPPVSHLQRLVNLPSYTPAQNAALLLADTVALAALSLPRVAEKVDRRDDFDPLSAPPPGASNQTPLVLGLIGWLEDWATLQLGTNPPADQVDPLLRMIPDYPLPPHLIWLDRRLPHARPVMCMLPWCCPTPKDMAPLLSKAARLFPGLAIKLSGMALGEQALKVTAWTIRVRGMKHRRHVKVLNKLFPPPSATDNRHQTAHLADLFWSIVHTPQPPLNNLTTQLSPWALLPTTPSSRLRAINGVLRFLPLGTVQTMVMGFSIAALGLEHRDQLIEMYLKSGVMWRDRNSQPALLKMVSTYVRKSATDLNGAPLPVGAVTQLAYYDLLSGRSQYTSDWDAEIRNRCSGTLHIRPPQLSLAPHPTVTGAVQFEWKDDITNTKPSAMRRSGRFYNLLRAELVKICGPLVTRRNTSEPLDRFVRRRHEWVASGSSAGASQHVRVSLGRKGQGQVLDTRIKVGKRAWAESLRLEDVLQALYVDTPVESAHASEKYENGKARAIYGVEPMHYVINTYATKGFEERLHLIDGLEKGASGHHACALEQMRAIITEDHRTECSMLDYADFNRHHTPEAQALIFDVFAQLGRKCQANPDWVAANEWVRDAKRNMFCKFPNDPQVKKVTQGMFSGTRSTDLINTLLNLAYFNVASQWVADTLQIRPESLYHVHQGDDVWISNKNRIWARAVYYCLNNMGFLFQPSKQMFGPHRGEYLRVMYSDGLARGYFARSLANFLLRPIQNANPLDPFAWARSLSDSTALLVRRGLSSTLAHSLYSNAVLFWARARAHPKDHAPISIPQEVFWLPGILGGLGSPPPGLFWYPDIETSPRCELPSFKSSLSATALTVPTRMTDDWIHHASQESFKARGPLHSTLDFKSLRDDMLLSNYAADIAAHLPDRGWSMFKNEVAKRRETLHAQVASWHTCTPRSVVTDNVSLASELARDWITSYPMAPARGVADMPLLSSLYGSLRSGHAPAIPPESRLTDALQAIITRSTFKSESTLARVFRITRLEAISLILTQADELGHGDAGLALAISPLLRSQNVQMVEAMLGGLGDIIPGFRPLVDSVFWQFAQTHWFNQLLVYSSIIPSAPPAEVMMRDAPTTSAWLNQALTPVGAVRRVLY